MPLYNVKRHAALFLRIECAECSFLLHGKRTLSWTSICNYHEYHIGENVGDVCRNVDGNSGNFNMEISMFKC